MKYEYTFLVVNSGVGIMANGPSAHCFVGGVVVVMIVDTKMAEKAPTASRRRYICAGTQRV